MRQLQVIAENLLGEIRWHSNVLGYAQCPGKDLHSNSSGPRDCRITIDSAPTIYCVHNSCASVIGECNRRLRSNIAKASFSRSLWRASGEISLSRATYSLQHPNANRAINSVLASASSVHTVTPTPLNVAEITLGKQFLL